MRKNRRNNAKRERIIMLASSAFVLTALTMTGIYMQARNEESKDDGYTLDFTAMEDNAEDKYQEIAQNNIQENAGDALTGENTENSIGNLEDDLDYMPMEAGSGNVEIPGLTGSMENDVIAGLQTVPGGEATIQEKENAQTGEDTPAEESQPEEARTEEASGEQETAGAGNVTVEKELHFAESDGLLRPIEGEVLMPFSMENSIYFSTLEQYERNPALMLVAQEGMTVSACAEGKVTDIYEDAKTGQTVVLDLGDGYQLTYGQLKDINVSVGSYVNEGETIGAVAAPTKYFSREGANLYLKLTMDGTAVDPEPLFR